MWFRRDLRLADHPALGAAVRAGGDRGVVGCFVVDDVLCAPAGPARAAFLAGCMASLDTSMSGALVVRRGRPEEVVPALAEEVGASDVFVTADAGPYGRARDARVAASLRHRGVMLRAVGTPYAVDPGTVRTASGSPYQVFTPFRRAWEAVGWTPPVPRSPAIRWQAASSDVRIGDLPGLCGGRRPPWWGDLPSGPPEELVEPGEQAALRVLDAFVSDTLERYAEGRDQLGVRGTSGLSPYLRFGCIHPRQVLHAVASVPGRGSQAFRSEVAWREFYADVLWHQPQSAHRSLQPSLAHLEWDQGPAAHRKFHRWAAGETGFPVVDAAMHQLGSEGWVHNRARMIAASFLVKDLHLHWRWGARWFMYRLVDGDLASNQHGWQWTAGTGTDAAPFHRVFNPTLQAARFDPDGGYVRRYLAGTSGGLPLLGYPEPMVDHRAERAEALRRYDVARGRGTGARGSPERRR